MLDFLFTQLRDLEYVVEFCYELGLLVVEIDFMVILT